MAKDSGRYQGVILAAGHGSRMGPFGDQLPKPIAPICNKPLLAYQLEAMARLGIRDVLVVIGHLGHRIIQTLGDGAEYGVNIRYIEQQKRLGLAHAVGQIELYVDRPFMLMLGDIFFEMSRLDDMLHTFETHHAAAVLAVKEEPDMDAVRRNFSVLLRDNGTVRRVIEKPRRPPNHLKGCGIYLFDLPIFEAISRTPRTAMRDEYELTDSIQILIDYEYPVRIAPIVEWDMNLTHIGDLICCCIHQLRRTGASKLVGRDCRIAPGTSLIDTVLGDRVTIVRPVTLERCVVLADAVVDETGTVCDAVFTMEGKLDANRRELPVENETDS